ADGHGADVGAATDAAARELRTQAETHAVTPELSARVRIQVDVIGGRAPLRGKILDELAVPGVPDMLAINPGVEGVGAERAGNTVLVLPHELVAMKLLGAKRPAPALDDFAIGLDLARLSNTIAVRAGLGRVAVSPDAMFRFRTDAFVEAADARSP